MKHIILGTAGHVDHGKTSLVKALTGIDTDRLKEEKERGITIELGFASLLLKDGTRLGIVDVPGHEKFVKNMVAGAGGIDLVALVIAADEGIMPQTREHLDICSLLGIRTGLVALTKADLVDADWLDLVREDIREYLKGTFLEEAPVIAVSAADGRGIPEFVSALEKIVAGLRTAERSDLFRLPIDRVFTMKGFGTVVTGTLISGKVTVGDLVEILPGKTQARVRGIQVHNEPAEFAEAGQRTAVNLQGIDREGVERGDVLVHPGIFDPALRIDVCFRYLPSAPGKLKNRSLVRYHSGTTEIISRLILLDRDELSPGESAFAQIVFEKQGVSMAGDRFVIRSYSPVRTIGGGVVLDPLPRKHKRFGTQVGSEMQVLLNGNDAERVSVILDRAAFAGIRFDRLSVRTGISASRLRTVLEALLSRGEAILFDKEEKRTVSASVYRDLKKRILDEIQNYQSKFPLKPGASKEELKSSRGYNPDVRLFQQALRDMEKEGRIVSEKETVRTPDHSVNLKGELEELRQKIAGIYLQSGLTPPSSRELFEKLGAKAAVTSVLNVMLKEGILIKVTEDLYFHREALDSLRENYRAMLQRLGKSTPTDFKELTGLSRKYIIPLIEYFDLTKLTIRVGDHRVLRGEGK